MSDKRIIEEPASEEIFHDDWLVKDSPLNETTKIQASVFMALIADEAKDGMVPYTMLATEWTALTTYYKDQVVIYNGELYRAKDTNVSPTFNPSAWTKISFDTLYRTTLANIKNSICEEWSTSGEYTLNDCAIHDDKLYKCVADTATVGTWVSSEWELVSIYEIIQNLPKSASDVTYDNTESGLEADNVQDALDEVAETITELSDTTEVTGTASGAIATFTDGADAPLKELKVAVTPYQDLSHGDPSPENICPIIGWDEAVVTRCGKNLATRQSLTSSSNGGLDANERIGNAITGTQYTISVDSLETNIKPIRVYIGNTEITSVSAGTWTANNRNSVTFTANISGKIGLGTNRETFSNSTKVLDNIQLEISSTATTYSPYNGATYTIDLDGTRYGGTLDVLSGVLTVDWVGVKGVTVARVGTSSTGIPYADTTNVYSDLVQNANAISNMYKRINTSQLIVDGVFRTYNGEFTIYDNRFSDMATAQSLLNDVEFVYELATPITVQLSPTQVKSLEGTNNIFADCGDINNVEYVRNLNITINDLLSRING